MCCFNSLSVFIHGGLTNRHILLLIRKNIHKEVSSSTISDWIKTILEIAKVNTDLFINRSEVVRCIDFRYFDNGGSYS